MDTMNKTLLILILITVLAFAIRFIGIDKYPSGFNADEAAIGYNAYSIIQTGKDEYGQFLPLSFKSFGDYKPGLYFYFAIPFVAILGLNEMAVRLPSVLLGTALVFLVYFLSLQFFKDKKIALITSLFTAINPWAIHFSRGAWESNAATFFITLGVYLFIKGLKNNLLMFASLISFLTSIYLYQSRLDCNFSQEEGVKDSRDCPFYQTRDHHFVLMNYVANTKTPMVLKPKRCTIRL